MRKAIIVDIDGTIASRGDRKPHDFSSSVLNDAPKNEVIRVIKNMVLNNDPNNKIEILFVSGRRNLVDMNGVSTEDYTRQWIRENVIAGNERTDSNRTDSNRTDNYIHYKTFLRNDGDFRDDSIVKKEIYEKNIKGEYDILAVFDDRDKVVNMWRCEGLLCLQVGYGAF